MPSAALDPGHFYQTSTDIATRKRREAKLKSNRSGHPIELSSRVLALCRDPRNSDVYAALSGSEARRVNIHEGTVDRPPFKPPTTPGPVHPLTCLAFVPGAGEGKEDTSVLLGGSWSARIYAWNASTRQLLFVHDGAHSDFIKALLLFPLPLLGKAPSSKEAPPTSRIVLASAAADTRVALWDVQPGVPVVGKRDPACCLLGTLTGHTRPVLALAADPAPADLADAVLFSGSSDGEVRRWRVRAAADPAQESQDPSKHSAVAAAAAVTFAERPFKTPLRPHPSSIYALAFAPSGDLWTAGADGTARCLVRPGEADDNVVQADEPRMDDQPWTVDTTLSHGTNGTNAVRSLALSPDGRFVVTGCRDEDVWVWDAASGDVLGKFTGHADEVVALLVDDGPLYNADANEAERGSEAGAKRRSWRVVSGALDSTVRVWNLGELLENQKEVGEEPEADTKKGESVQLTEEEERELAELMDE